MTLFGNLSPEPEKMNYPEDSLQKFLEDDQWWVPYDDNEIVRGMLIKCFVPHIEEIPYTLHPKRADHNDHGTAEAEIVQLTVKGAVYNSTLPVAAMPLLPGEVWAAYRAKKRPCLVLGSPSLPVNRSLTKGMPNRHTSPTLLVAPYYGIDRSTGRSGYKSDFVTSVRHCTVPQFVWDKLPIGGSSKESILRLDQLHAVGNHYKTIEKTGFKLSEEALEVHDELFNWHKYGTLESESVVGLYKQLLTEGLPDST